MKLRDLFRSKAPDRTRNQDATKAHRAAIEVWDKAVFAQPKPSVDRIQELAREALRFELQALNLINPDEQPTYGVLCRSAATLALHADDKSQARALVQQGLASPGLAAAQREELMDVLQQL